MTSLAITKFDTDNHKSTGLPSFLTELGQLGSRFNRTTIFGAVPRTKTSRKRTFSIIRTTLTLLEPAHGIFEMLHHSDVLTEVGTQRRLVSVVCIAVADVVGESYTVIHNLLLTAVPTEVSDSTDPRHQCRVSVADPLMTSESGSVPIIDRSVLVQINFCHKENSYGLAVRLYSYEC